MENKEKSTFKNLGLSEKILRAVENAGYEKPSPIQQMAIPSILKGRDIFGCAQTGTGKTAAFALPIMPRNLPFSSPQCHFFVKNPNICSYLHPLYPIKYDKCMPIFVLF